MPNSRRIVDLVPRQWWSPLAILAVGGALIAGLEGLYAWMPRIAAHTTDGRVMAFDLDSEGSLGAWFSSLTLLAASLTAWLVFTIRRHQPDDYRGRFGTWRWAALVVFVMSVDEAASLHEGFKELMAYLTGQRFGGDGSLWWVLAYLPILGYLGLRILWDVRRWWGTVAWFSLSAGLYAAAVAVQLEWIWPQSGARGVMLEEGCEMAANLTLLVGLLWHARLLLRVASGQMPMRRGRDKAAAAAVETKPKRSRAERTASAEAPSEERARTSTADAGASKTAAASSRTLAGSGRSDSGSSSSTRQLRVDAAESPPARPLSSLSRAERKALKRQLRSRDRYSSDDEDE